MESNEKSTVEFEQKFFTAVEGSYFCKSKHTSEPVFVMNLGGEEVLLPLPGIRREFQFEEESPDEEMLELVSSGLDYVKVLMPGDDLPPELLTGEASWEISDAHRTIARQRISMQLVSWMSGDENLISDPEQLIQIADDPGVKEKIWKLRKLAAKNRSILDTTRSVGKLLAIAVQEFGEEFDMADGQTSEMISVLKNIATLKDYIRSVRNSVYRRLVAWDSLLRGWEREPGRLTETAPDLLRETYRFLAPRYMQTDDWLLASQVQGNQEDMAEQLW